MFLQCTTIPSTSPLIPDSLGQATSTLEANVVSKCSCHNTCMIIMYVHYYLLYGLGVAAVAVETMPTIH